MYDCENKSINGNHKEKLYKIWLLVNLITLYVGKFHNYMYNEKMDSFKMITKF